MATGAIENREKTESEFLFHVSSDVMSLRYRHLSRIVAHLKNYYYGYRRVAAGEKAGKK